MVFGDNRGRDRYGIMTAQYTMYLKDYFLQGYELPANIDEFLTLNIAGKTYNVRKSFTLRFNLREIGSETQELFKHNLEVSIDEALAKYNPQLYLLQESYEKLLQRTETESTSRSENENANNEATINQETQDYLNPANANATKLQGRNTATNSGTGRNNVEKTVTETKQKTTILAKSNPELLNLSYQVTDIFNKILDFLSKNFIGIY